MKSLEQWRNEKLYEEISVTTDPDFIERGLPTLESIRDNIWGHSKTPPYIPSTEEEPVGNEEEQIFNHSVSQDQFDEPDSSAPSSQSGGTLKDMAWSMQAMNVMRRKNIEPTTLPALPPLGDLGNSSLKYREPVAAGETPLLSKGMPIGNLKGQFESFGNYLGYREAVMGPMGSVNPIGHIDSQVVVPAAGSESELQKEPVRTPQKVAGPLKSAWRLIQTGLNRMKNVKNPRILASMQQMVSNELGRQAQEAGREDIFARRGLRTAMQQKRTGYL